MANRRANTLVEVIVASGVFLVILVTVVLIYRSGRSALDKTSAQSDPFRMAAIAQDHLKSELRGATLLCPRAPVPGDQRARVLIYQPEFTEVDHLPRFQKGVSPPALLLKETPTLIEVLTNARGTKELVRRGGGRPQRKLADLGPLGSLDLAYDNFTVGRKVIAIKIVAGLNTVNDATRSGKHVLMVELPVTSTTEIAPELFDNFAEAAPPPEGPEPEPEGDP